MKKYIDFIIIIVTCFFMIEFMLNRELVFDSVAFSLNIWVKNVAPSLFPFFVLTDILISYNFVKYLPKWFINFFSNLFNIKKEAVLVFFLSIISGFPSNAKNARKLYDMKILNKYEASHLLMFTHFSNPLFILGTVAIYFLNNKNLGIIILLAHYFSNFVVGIIFRNNNFNIKNVNSYIYNDNLYFGEVFVTAIKSAIDTILLICGTLTCFLIVSSIIVNRFDLSVSNEIIVKSILEITIGLKEISMCNISDLYLVMLASFILSFGGLSVHMQVKSQLVGTDISYKPFFVGRIYQTLISVVLAYIFYFILT